MSDSSLDRDGAGGKQPRVRNPSGRKVMPLPLNDSPTLAEVSASPSPTPSEAESVELASTSATQYTSSAPKISAKRKDPAVPGKTVRWSDTVGKKLCEVRWKRG